MLLNDSFRLLAGAFITLPSIALILYFRDQLLVVESVLFLHSVIFDALSITVSAQILRDYRQRKPFDSSAPLSLCRRMNVAMVFLAIYALTTGIGITLMPLDFPVVAALILGFGLATAPMIAVLLLNHSFYLKSRMGKVWIKALDFPYLLFAFVGLLRVVANIFYGSDPASFFNTFALVFLSLALSVRVAKAIIEVFFDEWIQPSKKRP